MNRIEIDASADEGGNIHIHLPGVRPHHQVRVSIEWQHVASEAHDWPPGWFGATAGAIDDPTFLRSPEGTYEKRDEFE